MSKMLTFWWPKKSLQQTLELKPWEDPFVDGLRGISVLMVIWFHTLFTVQLAFRKTPGVFQQFVHQFPEWSTFVFGFDKAVDIFFMISAYLLGRSLFADAKKGQMRVRRFYIHRFFRIYPLFLLALILYGLGNVDGLLKDGIHNLLFIDNYFHNTIIPVGWSLSVEMQCYLVLPLLIWLAWKSRYPLLVLFVVLMLSMAGRAWLVLSDPVLFETPFYFYLNGQMSADHYMDTLYYSTPGRVGSFIMGLIWARMETEGHLRHWFESRLNYAVVHVGLFLLAFSVIYFSFRYPSYWQDSEFYQPFNEVLNGWLVVLHRIIFCFALLLLILMVRHQSNFVLAGGFKRLLTSKVWRPFSRMAFPMYLFHFPFIAVAWVIVLGTTKLKTVESVDFWQAGLAFIVATILVTWFSVLPHRLLEVKMIRFGKKLAP
jgi:peptidoglycan/LPS O-acetylase OafA/YrhL